MARAAEPRRSTSSPVSTKGSRSRASRFLPAVPLALWRLTVTEETARWRPAYNTYTVYRSYSYVEAPDDHAPRRRSKQEDPAPRSAAAGSGAPGVGRPD